MDLDQIWDLIESVSEGFLTYSTALKSDVFLTNFEHKLLLSLSAQIDYL